MLNYQQVNLFGRIQTSQTGFQPFSGTSPDGECYLGKGSFGRCCTRWAPFSRRLSRDADKDVGDPIKPQRKLARNNSFVRKTEKLFPRQSRRRRCWRRYWRRRRWLLSVQRRQLWRRAFRLSWLKTVCRKYLHALVEAAVWPDAGIKSGPFCPKIVKQLLLKK